MTGDLSRANASSAQQKAARKAGAGLPRQLWNDSKEASYCLMAAARRCR